MSGASPAHLCWKNITTYNLRCQCGDLCRRVVARSTLHLSQRGAPQRQQRPQAGLIDPVCVSSCQRPAKTLLKHDPLDMFVEKLCCTAAPRCSRAGTCRTAACVTVSCGCHLSPQSGPNSRVGEVVLRPNTDAKSLLRGGEPEKWLRMSSPAPTRPKAVEVQTDRRAGVLFEE